MEQKSKNSLKKIIQESHERSENYGVEKNRVYPGKILNNKELQKRLLSNKVLIDIANPILIELNEFLVDSGFFIVLTDHEGCILKVLGDKRTIHEAELLNMVSGAYMDEKSIGTNAMSVALSENMPIQITSKEHFISAYHRWTCSASPIHDISGKIIGCVNLTGNSKLVHPHTLGMIISAVQAIENHLENHNIQKQLYDTNMYAFSMMNNLTYGVFAIDLNDDIHWVNDTACRSLNIRRMHLLDRPIDKIFSDWPKAKKRILSNISFVDEEGKFLMDHEKYLFNALTIKTKENEILGFLLTFRALSRAIRLVNKYTGMQAHFTFDDIYCKSSTSRNLIRYAKTVANSPTTILISGESGTGKEVFAQAIHNASERKEAGFVAVNCGAISPTLIESELFGYDHGAFTGAQKGGKPGKFELAHKGTLFLDEIGEMPLDMQIRLLRALQESRITRIGGEKEISVDVRIIAATNKNLEDEVNEGRFRLDLYYRLNVINLHIPPLRKRREDILPLMKDFLKHKAQKLKKNIPDLNEEVMNKMNTYDWPGNVRELENFIEKLVIFDGEIITDNTDSFTPQKTPDKSKPKSQSNFDVTENIKLKSLGEIEKEAIIFTLSQTGNNMTQTAKTLGISRNALYQKIKKHGINKI